MPTKLDVLADNNSSKNSEEKRGNQGALIQSFMRENYRVVNQQFNF